MEKTDSRNSSFFKKVFIMRYLRSRFNLHSDMLEEESIVSEIIKNSDLVGTNLWLLICAIFIASIGLNVNSTAVIIGAMLISPLMGPIMGISLGVATFRYRLIQTSAKSLAFAVAVSVLTSTTYFFLSPLDTAQSELLARTNPTIWDVLIALIGGIAGMIGASRKQMGNVIPGVAIATALMPPLCTAGFGLARGEWTYFFGAFYLFFINSVFICVGGVLILKYLKLTPDQMPHEAHARLLRRVTIGIALLTTLPSFLLTYRLLHEAYLTRSLNHFLEREIQPLDIEIVNRTLFTGPNKNEVHIVYLGNKISKEKEQELQTQLGKYGLSQLEIHLRSAMKDSLESSAHILKAGIVEELFQKNQMLLTEKNKRIEELESLLEKKQKLENLRELGAELHAHIPTLKNYTLNRSSIYSAEGIVEENKWILVGKIESSKKIPPSEQVRLRNWLKAKFQTEDTAIQFHN